MIIHTDVPPAVFGKQHCMRGQNRKQSLTHANVSVLNVKRPRGLLGMLLKLAKES